MTSNPLGDDASQSEAEHDFNFHSECYACPVGSFFRGAQTAQPDGVSDIVEHMLTAAHEVLEVARAAIDTADAAIERQQHARRAAPAHDSDPSGARPSNARRVRRIEIA